MIIPNLIACLLFFSDWQDVCVHACAHTHTIYIHMHTHMSAHTYTHILRHSSTPVISALRKWCQEDQDFKVILNCAMDLNPAWASDMKPCLNKTKQTLSQMSSPAYLQPWWLCFWCVLPLVDALWQREDGTSGEVRRAPCRSPKVCREPAQSRKEEVRGSFPIGAELVQDALPWAVYGQALLRIRSQCPVRSPLPVTSAYSSPDPISCSTAAFQNPGLHRAANRLGQASFSQNTLWTTLVGLEPRQCNVLFDFEFHFLPSTWQMETYLDSFHRLQSTYDNPQSMQYIPKFSPWTEWRQEWHLQSQTKPQLH